MSTASIRDLRYNFPEIEARLKKGEVIEIHKGREVIARLHPVCPPARPYPDFAAEAKKTFGKKVSKQTGTELVAEFRGDH